MNFFKVSVLCAALALSGLADAKGGMSSGGGRSSMSSGSFSRPNSAPSIAPAAPRQNSAPVITPNAPRPNSAPVVTPNAAPRTTTTTTTTTSVNRTSSYGYRSPYVGGGYMYGGMGMGYGYSNGLLTGMIIGNMMHPQNTVVYAGGGQYNNNALLYPDGRVVNQQGYQVGTYANGQFIPVNGGMVAQAVPADAGQYQNSNQPIVLEKAGPSGWEITGMIILGILCILLFLFIIGVI